MNMRNKVKICRASKIPLHDLTLRTCVTMSLETNNIDLTKVRLDKQVGNSNTIDVK